MMFCAIGRNLDMIRDMTPVNRDPKIDYIGFNVENGKIIAEKIYYKKEKTETNTINN